VLTLTAVARILEMLKSFDLPVLVKVPTTRRMKELACSSHILERVRDSFPDDALGQPGERRKSVIVFSRMIRE
jgi:hypothetical protein